MDAAKVGWQRTPMPVRGGLLRALASALTAKLDPLARLITLETGKILSEGRGEVQEAIDICHHAAGLSRSIDGSLLPSERREHIMMERWLPLSGHVGVISAFNFPLAVFFCQTHSGSSLQHRSAALLTLTSLCALRATLSCCSGNFALSLLMGNTTVWKPSETTTLTAIAACNIISATLRQEGQDGGLFTLCSGRGSDVGQAMAEDGRLELLSFTGSTRAGRDVAVRVAQRLGKSLLELGGNNAMLIMQDADLDLALRAVLFAAVGTAGQRCTSLRRLYLHTDIYDSFLSSLVTAYASVRVGDPFHASTLCGPLHTARAVKEFVAAVQRIEAEGGRVVTGGKTVEGAGFYVQPTIAAMPADAPMLQHELFAPVLSVVRVGSLTEGIALHNGVKQGLSSSLFTRDVGSIMRWLGSEGSDCGLVNVNIGTSGAEIGGAFGGEKDTGGGRESGSDAWKAYGRRITAVINYGKELPLAQGVSFL